MKSVMISAHVKHEKMDVKPVIHGNSLSAEKGHLLVFLFKHWTKKNTSSNATTKTNFTILTNYE